MGKEVGFDEWDGAVAKGIDSNRHTFEDFIKGSRSIDFELDFILSTGQLSSLSSCNLVGGFARFGGFFSGFPLFLFGVAGHESCEGCRCRTSTASAWRW